MLKSIFFFSATRFNISDGPVQEWLQLLVKFCEEHIRQRPTKLFQFIKRRTTALNMFSLMCSRVQVQLFDDDGNSRALSDIFLFVRVLRVGFSDVALTLKFMKSESKRIKS